MGQYSVDTKYHRSIAYYPNVYAMEHDIPYFGANLPNDQCQDCGYLGDIQDKCPKCGSSNIKSLKRITGYCSTDYRHFNPGKQDEVHHRVKHIG